MPDVPARRVLGRKVRAFGSRAKRGAEMWLVVFRACIRQFDAEYTATATRMRELALGEFGCLAFHAVTEGNEEIALSYWPDEDSIRRWREHPEHRLAQQAGRERWYASYSVQVARISREYRVGEA